MKALLHIAFRNLQQAKRRTLLLGSAVALVAGLFLTLRAVGQSIGEHMIEAATTLQSGHVNVGGFFKARKRDSLPFIIGRAQLLRDVRELVPEAASIIDRHLGFGRMVSPVASMNVGISAIIPEDEGTLFETIRLAPESEYRPDGGEKTHGSFSGLSRPNTAIIFASQAKKLEVGVGDTVTYVTEGSGGESNTVDLEIVAVASDMGFMSSYSMFTPRQTVLDLYKLSPDTTGQIMVYLHDPEQSVAVMERLRRELPPRGHELLEHDPKPFFLKFDKISGEDWMGQKIDLLTWSESISFLLWITTALDAVTYFVVGVLLLIISGGVSNAMYMSVRERTKEIGTMRAIGTKRPFIVGLFVYESAMLGLFASALGVLIAMLLLTGLNLMEIPIEDDGMRLFLFANTFHVQADWRQVVSTLLLFTGMTGLAALYPAWKASRLRPIEALMQGK